MAKQSTNQLGPWVVEKIKKMTNSMNSQEDLNDRLAILEPYQDLLTGARDALQAYGVKDEELNSVNRGLKLIDSEMKTIEMRLDFESDLLGDSSAE